MQPRAGRARRRQVPGAGDEPEAADFSGAELYCADLRLADLENANLGRADGRLAKLEEAVLIGANLREANFSGASFTYGGRGWPRPTSPAPPCARRTSREADLIRADFRGAEVADAFYAAATAYNLRPGQPQRHRDARRHHRIRRFPPLGAAGDACRNRPRDNPDRVGQAPTSTIATTGPPPCGPWCIASTETNTAGSPIAAAATPPTAPLEWR